VLVGFTRLRGGLSIVNVLATTFLSGISGSAVADTSAIGSVMIPQMEKAGYPRVFATNLIITSSVQALLVPPSHNAVLYSLATGGTMLLNLGIGLCHPPVGAILFVGCAVGKVTIEQVMRKIWPFYAVMFVVLMFVTYIPEISLWLPRHVLR
jgi:TRAP-type C4-dicarboxylate transport system permease large subunit